MRRYTSLHLAIGTLRRRRHCLVAGDSNGHDVLPVVEFFIKKQYILCFKWYFVVFLAVEKF